MRDIRKVIIRANRDSATKSMVNHIDKMVAKGWTVYEVFANDAGLKYQLTICFYKY